LAFGPGLLIRRRLAMKIAYHNRPEGKGYTQAMSRLTEFDGLHTMDGRGKVDSSKKTDISCVFWLHEDGTRLDILREIRDQMTPGERSRLNSRISACRRVEKIIIARDGDPEAEGKIKDSPLPRLKTMNVEMARKLAHLEEEKAARDTDGSLFDLARQCRQHRCRDCGQRFRK
jgi:hypothetical protein